MTMGRIAAHLAPLDGLEIEELSPACRNRQVPTLVPNP